MPNIGPLEVAIVAIIALIIFGPKRLPELGKSLGDGMREFKASISGENDDDDEDDDDELPAQIEDGVAEEDPDDAVVTDETEDASEPESDQSAETAERTTS